MPSLEERIEALEAESEIKKLKARYLNACDKKDINAMRNCFTEDAIIEYPPLGSFDLNGLIGIFTQMAATTAIVDTHQGHNAEIEVSGDEATGIWNLGFATYDPDAKTFRLLSSFYNDRYRKTAAGWRISFTRSEPRAIVDGNLQNDTVNATWIDA